MVANAKSLFLDLKISDQVANAAMIDEGLRADLKRVKVDPATVTKGKESLRKANQAFKEAEVKVQEDERTEDSLRCSLEEEVDGLGKLVKRLEGRVQELRDAAAFVKAGRKQRETTIFEAGVAEGVKDCVKSAYCFFPDNDWAKLGPDVVVTLEEAKAEYAVGSEKAQTSAGKLLGGTLEEKAAIKDQPEAIKTPPADPDVTASVGTLVATPPQSAISPDAPAADEVPKASSSPATS